MNKNKIMFIITLTILMLIGLTAITATDTDANDTTITQTSQTNTINDDTTNTNEISTSKTDNIQETNNSQETITDKKGSKTQNLKASREVTATTYTELNSYLTGNAYDTVTIDIGNDIQLAGSIGVNSAIKNLTINGNGKTINGNNKYCFLNMSYKINVIINDLTMTHGNSTYGGAIYGRNDINLTVTNSNFTYNNAGYGGAINVNAGNLTVTNSNFINNNASHGGAIYGRNDIKLIVTYSNFTYNKAKSGGAIYVNAGNLTVTNSNFFNNNASEGGAIYGYRNSTITVSDSNYSHNNASEGGAINGYEYNNIVVTNSNLEYNKANVGGAISGKQSCNNILVTNSNFFNNNASVGGAIYGYRNSTITVSDSIFSYNNAFSYGGAIYGDYWSNITVINNNLTHNNATNYYGGAIYGYCNNIMIINNNLTHNEAKWGGSIYAGQSNLTITNSTLMHNYAREYGGAIFGCNITVINTNLSYNTANNSGGAIEGSENMTIINTNLSHNIANNCGGAIYGYSGNITFTNSTLTHNNATYGGAIYWAGMQGPTNMILKNSNITDNYVINNESHVIDFRRFLSIIVTDNTFINNTDNVRDMLFSDSKYAKMDIHNNYYIDNFLEVTIIKPNVVVVTDNEAHTYDYYIDLKLRSIYNDTVSNGTLNVYVNGDLKDSTNVTDGYARIFFDNSDLTKRENDITLEYISLSKHYQNTTTVFTVTKEINTTLSIQAPATMTAGETAQINFTLADVDNNPLSGETIHVFVNEEEVAILTTEGGVASYNFTALGDNRVPVEATHHTSVDSFYLSAMDAEAEIKVYKIQQEIQINPGNITPHIESSITIHLFDPDGMPIINKTVIVNITEEGKPDITGIVTTNNNGVGVFNFTPTDEGILNITVSSPGDDIYHYESETVQVSKNFITTNLIVTATDTPINQTNIITVEVLPLTDLLSGTVELNISGEIHNITIRNGRGTYHGYKSDTSGEKLVNAKFISDNPVYANSTMITEFKVNKLPTSVTIEVLNRTAGNVTLKVLVFPEDEISSIVNGGNIVIESVNGETKTIIYNNTLENGELIYLTDVNETGEYEFEVTYHGNDYFLGDVDNTEFIEVLLLNTNTIIQDKTTFVGDTITLNASVTDADGNLVNDGNVTFYIDNSPLYYADGTPVEVKLENGIAITEYILPAIYGAGNHTITANYTGNNKYNTSSDNANLQIDLHETIMDVTPVNNTKGNTTIEVTLNTTCDKPVPGAPIIVTDENGTIIGEGFTDENGTANITVDIPVGDNNITITYPGDNTHSPQNETITVNVTPRESDTTGTVNNNTVGNVTIDVEVVDPITGEPITGPVNIIVDGEVVGNGTLDDEGKATIPVDLDKKGNYTIIVEYEGNNDYNGSNDTLDNVYIAGKDVDIKIVIDNPIVENTTINVTITDPETGEPIPNATVNVTLPNGTNVTGTTDENGTAIITIDVPTGDNNITITYPGDDDHEGQQENITVKVKSYSVVTVDAVEGVVLDNVTFTANVLDYQDNKVNGGYVVFKVGGKTLTDANGNQIRTPVENGIAKLSYTAESGWLVDSHPNLKVQATYSGTSIVLSGRSDNSKVTIYKRNATVQVSAPDDYVNGTLHIDAVVKDQNGSLINDGVLVFKLNGLSLKDENNKGIVAKVTNGRVHLDVKLPFAYSAKKYNLTAVYSNKIYNKATGTNTTSLKAIPTYVNATVTIKDQFSKPVVTGQIYNGFNNAILEGTAIINIKFDGISYAKKVKIQNGTFTETLEGIPIYKPGTHKIEIAAGANSHYDAVRKTITSKTTPKYNVNTIFTNITRNKTTTRVQAKIVDDKNKNVQRDLSITIKFNGKSFLVNKTVRNGKVDVLVDTSTLKNRNYTLELVSGANTYYNAGKATVELPKY